MTPERLAEIEARADAATLGPWQEIANDWGEHIAIDAATDWTVVALLDPQGTTEITGSGLPQADAEFIAHARTDVPALVAELRRLRAAVDAANKRLIDSAGFDVADLMYSLDECTARAERAEAAVDAALALTDGAERRSHIISHNDTCHRYHASCLAVKLRRALAPVADPDPHTTSDKETAT